MSQMEKFLFETSFDSERDREAKARAAAEAAAAEEPPAPTFSEEDLAAAREAAFAEGKAAGLAEAESAQSRRLADSIDALLPQCARLTEELAELDMARHRDCLEAAMTVVRKLFPHLARDHGLAEMQAVVDDCLERLRDEPRLMIRSADQDLDALKERIEASAAQSGFEGKLVFLVDERIAAGDLRIEWADGGAERDLAGLWKEIDAVIARALTPVAAPPRAGSDSGKNQEAAPQGARDTSQPQEPAAVEPLRRAQIA
jgi:flagellar assembly protein FliH